MLHIVSITVLLLEASEIARIDSSFCLVLKNTEMKWGGKEATLRRSVSVFVACVYLWSALMRKTSLLSCFNAFSLFLAVVYSSPQSLESLPNFLCGKGVVSGRDTRDTHSELCRLLHSHKQDRVCPDKTMRRRRGMPGFCLGTERLFKPGHGQVLSQLLLLHIEKKNCNFG